MKTLLFTKPFEYRPHAGIIIGYPAGAKRRVLELDAPSSDLDVIPRIQADAAVAAGCAEWTDVVENAEQGPAAAEDGGDAGSRPKKAR